MAGEVALRTGDDKEDAQADCQEGIRNARAYVARKVRLVLPKFFPGEEAASVADEYGARKKRFVFEDGLEIATSGSFLGMALPKETDTEAVKEVYSPGPFGNAVIHRILSAVFPRKLHRYTVADLAFISVCVRYTLLGCDFTQVEYAKSRSDYQDQFASMIDDVGTHRAKWREGSALPLKEISFDLYWR